MKIQLLGNSVKGDKLVREKRILYYLYVFGLVIEFSRYVVLLMDLYITRSAKSVSGVINELYIDNDIYKYESVIIGMLLLLIFFLFNNIGTSLLMTSLLMFILTHASYIKYLNRRELFRIDDLKLTEAAKMAFSYIQFRVDVYFLIFVFFLLGNVLLGYILNQHYKKYIHLKISRKKHFALHMVLIISTMIFTVVYNYLFMENKKSVSSVEQMDIVDSENEKYVLYRFLENNEVSNISVANVDESYDYFDEMGKNLNKQEMDEEDYPNVIVIMNESWWNTDDFEEGRISFSKDPMEPYRRLQNICSSGFLTSNVYGGGTVSSEAEFLTGLNTKYFVSDSGIYNDVKNEWIPNITDYFHSLNYEAIAIHPFYKTFYNRDVMYQSMGFDKMIFDDNMDYTEIYTKYISDDSFANQVIKEFENKNEDKVFIWGVTMGNHKRHLDYHEEQIDDFDYPISIQTNQGSLSESDMQDVINYVNGIYYANLAYEKLVNYFSGIDEPVVLVMFGDHIPNFWPSSLETLGFSHEDKSDEMLNRMYSVPVLMWTNISDEKYSFTGENINYLSEIILDEFKMPDAPFLRVLRTLRGQLHTNTRYIVKDSNKNRIKTLTQQQMISVRHFEAIQYNILFGDCNRRNIWKCIDK